MVTAAKIVGWIWACLLIVLSIGAFGAGVPVGGIVMLACAFAAMPLPWTRRLLVRRGLRPIWQVAIAAGAVVVGLVIIGITTPESPEQRAARLRAEETQAKADKDAEIRGAAEAAAQKARAAADAEAKRASGAQCLNADGSSDSFTNVVIQNLRDPDSFVGVGTKMAPQGHSHMHAIAMRYRAKNGFGGYNVETAIGMVDDRDCHAELIGSQ